MSRARKIWKWAAALAGGLLVLLAVLVGALRLWLENSPTLAPDVVTRVESVTGMRFAFAALDARLGLHGPEIVFKDARITMPGQLEPLVTARAGRVGFDLWRSLRTGRLAAGRVVLEGAHVGLFLQSDGVELRGQGTLGGGGAHLTVAELPVGDVRIEDSSLVVTDLRSGAAPWRVDNVNLELERDPRSATLVGDIRLPDALGARLSFEAHLDGDLATPAGLGWQADVQLKRGALGGWTALLPQWPYLPSAGRGDLAVSARGRGAELEHARAEFALEHVVMRGAGGAAPRTLAELGGTLEVTHAPGRWAAAGRDLTINPGHDAWRHGEFSLELEATGDRLDGLRLRSPSLRLDALGALVPLLPEGVVREAGTALAPRGALTMVDLAARRGPRPGEWRLEGGLRFTGLATGAWRALPGITGLDGEATAHANEARVALRSSGFTLDLPKVLRAPVGAQSLKAALAGWWQPDGWRFAVDGLEVHSPEITASGRVRLWLPADGESPRLVIDARAADVDARAAPKVLPGRVIPAKAMDWLDHAFLDGRARDVTIEFAGPTREFPFRDGGGRFLIRVPVHGVRVHYADGFPDLEEITAEAEFRNQGFTATASHVRVGGLEISDAKAGMADFHDAELTAVAHARGELKDGLAFLQGSPIGPKLGSYFMGIAAQGALAAEVRLDLPFAHFADRHVDVSATVERANAHLPGLDDEVRAVSGSFTLHDREVDVPQVAATLLGGPLRGRARTVPGPSGQAGDRVLLVEAQGRAAAERLQPLVHLAGAHALEGQLDWRAQARIPRYEWRPPPDPLPPGAPEGAVPVAKDTEVRWLPATVRIDSSLVGLALGLPAPLAKGADEPRALRLDVGLDPGLGEDAPPLPPGFRRREAPHEPQLSVRIALGRDSGVLEWRGAESLALRRGTLRFGSGAAALHDGAGLVVEGRLAEFDLSAWLGVRLTASGSGKGVTDYLRAANVQVDRFSLFGYHFADLGLTLAAAPGEWRCTAAGPDAAGAVTVPWDLKGSQPLVLDLDRLRLGERTTTAGGEPADPRDLPALAIQVRDFEFQKRRFGAVSARIVRTDEGLRLDQGTSKGASYQLAAHGRWVHTNGGQQTQLSFQLDSTDLLDTLSAWGFEKAITAKSAQASGELRFAGGLDDDLVGRLNGAVKITVGQGQLLQVAPGAGRVLGLLSVGALPRRLTLDFSDLTEKGFAFDTIHGDFDFRDGNAYTNDLVLKGPAAEIGIVGRTGLKARDYDQTAKVTGNVGGSLAAAGALAGGPAVGAALLLFSTVFKEPLSGIARGYYRITGSWEAPKVERIGAGAAREAGAAAATPPPEPPQGEQP